MTPWLPTEIVYSTVVRSEIDIGPDSYTSAVTRVAGMIPLFGFLVTYDGNAQTDLTAATFQLDASDGPHRVHLLNLSRSEPVSMRMVWPNSSGVNSVTATSTASGPRHISTVMCPNMSVGPLLTRYSVSVCYRCAGPSVVYSQSDAAVSFWVRIRGSPGGYLALVKKKVPEAPPVGSMVRMTINSSLTLNPAPWLQPSAVPSLWKGGHEVRFAADRRNGQRPGSHFSSHPAITALAEACLAATRYDLTVPNGQSGKKRNASQVLVDFTTYLIPRVSHIAR